MKKVLSILTILILFGSIASAARLYNADFPAVEEFLDDLNATYGLNADMVLLDSGDTCAGETNFGLCSTQEYSDSGDLLFVIDLTQRRMESMLREGLSDYVLPKQETLTFEQQVKTNLQNEDYEGAFSSYITLTQNYFKNQCSQLSLNNCRVDLLDEALQELERQEAEASAGRINKLTRNAVRAIVLLTIFMTIVRAIRGWMAIVKNRKLIRELKKNTDFALMQVKHDKNIFEKDRKNLKKKLKLFDKSLEDLQSQSSSIIAKRLESNDYIGMLQKIQTEYEDMLMTIAKTDTIDKKKKKIKKKNI